MSRLIAFGCSITYGEGLDDCWNAPDPGPVPSKFAWPALLGTHLNKEVVNLGIPGASNKHIWHTILNTSIKSTDTVVILWTHSARSCIIKSKEHVNRLLPSDATPNKGLLSERVKRNKHYYKRLYNNYDAEMDSITRINYINYYLTRKAISSYHFISERQEHQYNWNETNIPVVCPDRENFGFALDGMHPGKLSQEFMSNKMLSNIN